MNTPSLIARTITGGRSVFNRIDQRTFAVTLAVVTFAALWAISASAYLPSRFELQPGEVARDLVRAPRDITFENQADSDRRRVQAAENVPRVYSYDAAVMPRVLTDMGTAYDAATAVVAQEKAAAQAASRPYDPASAAKKIAAIPGLTKISAADLTGFSSLADDRLALMRGDLLDSMQRILEGSVTENTLATDRDRFGSLLQTMKLTRTEQVFAVAIGAAFLEPNNIYNPELTQQARERTASDIQPVMVTVRSGETIVASGQVVTEDNVAALRALGLTEQGGKYGAILGVGLVVLVQVLIMFFYIKRFEPKVRVSRALQFIVATLVILFAAMTRIFEIEPLSPLLLPVSSLAMLGTFLLGTRLAVIMVLIVCANLAMTVGPDPQFLLVALMGGLAGAFLVTSVFQRRDLIRAGIIAGTVIIVTAIGAGQLGESSWWRILSGGAWGAGNTVLAVMLTGALLTFYEMLFNLPTPLKLLELADPTRPLLKELMMKAPGTYNHSIIMGNIAETAAEAIGANPLMARTGAYYHDIGKLNRPEYFIENQFHIKNPHDRLTPGLSRLAITAHVKDGVALARAEGLPPEIVAIIKEHHGTTVLSYFYQKAKDADRGGRIDEETYRYAGQKPSTREAAIIMLADSVEAAVRSLANPTVRNIKTVIRDIFDQRLRDGQLSDSGMTFSDLEKVRHVFEKCLQGFGSRRIAYPASQEKPRGPTAAGAPRSFRAGG
ncbi:MAG: HD family phosphohydrolase [Thermoleophilia bacterium]